MVLEKGIICTVVAIPVANYKKRCIRSAVAPPTDVVVSLSTLGDVVIDVITREEVERLECVEYEVAHVFVHVCPQDASVEIVDRTTAVHHLEW